MNSISFFTPVYYEASSHNIKYKIINTIEDYFSLNNTKACVLSESLTMKSQSVAIKTIPRTRLLTAIIGTIKVISYATGIIPLIMLIAKVIFRSAHSFYIAPLPPPLSTTTPSQPLALPVITGDNFQETPQTFLESEASPELEDYRTAHITPLPPPLPTPALSQPLGLPVITADNFQETLQTFLESEAPLELEGYRAAFLQAFPPLREIITIIHRCDTSLSGRSMKLDLINTLYVAAGLKPVYVIENDSYSIYSKLFLLTSIFPHVKLVKSSTSFPQYYLINEKPLPQFDPRRFIKNFEYSSLQEAVCYAFPNQHHPKSDQLLSYLLGFGPTWEAYISPFRKGSPAKVLIEKASSIFSDEHYFQLGEVRNHETQAHKTTREELIELGKLWSIDSITHPRPLALRLQDNELIAINIEHSKLYMYYALDKTSYQTQYVQQSMSYRKRLLSLFDIPKAC